MEKAEQYQEESYLMLSGIQHFAFCRRQWALIHIEQQWAENAHTAVGELLHKRVHDPILAEKRKDIRIVRALPVASKELGINGECDVVEFHACEDGIKLHGHKGLYRIFPIEYKKGKPKTGEEDILQLVAQTMCLEEMFSATIPEGALFYGETRRRETIAITDALRGRVRELFTEMHGYYDRGYTPKVKRSKKCNGCSLKDICMPGLEKAASANEYVSNMLREDMP